MDAGQMAKRKSELLGEVLIESTSDEDDSEDELERQTRRN